MFPHQLSGFKNGRVPITNDDIADANLTYRHVISDSAACGNFTYYVYYPRRLDREQIDGPRSESSVIVNDDR
jgi:hypothetical protein